MPHSISSTINSNDTLSSNRFSIKGYASATRPLLVLDSYPISPNSSQLNNAFSSNNKTSNDHEEFKQQNSVELKLPPIKPQVNKSGFPLSKQLSNDNQIQKFQHKQTDNPPKSKKYYYLSATAIHRNNGSIYVSKVPNDSNLKSHKSSSINSKNDNSTNNTNSSKLLPRLTLSSHLQTKSLISNSTLEYRDPAIARFVGKKKEIKF